MTFSFCPICGTYLDFVYEKGNSYSTCPLGHYANHPSQSTNVAAIIFENGNKVLLEQKMLSQKQEMWVLPGGNTKPKESPEHALSRQIFDLTGLYVNVGQLIDAKSEDSICTLFYEANLAHNLTQVSEVWSNRVFAWFSIQDIPWDKIVFSQHKDVLTGCLFKSNKKVLQETNTAEKSGKRYYDYKELQIL